MPAMDKLLKFLNPPIDSSGKSKKIVETLDEDTQRGIINDVITGYEVDLDSRARWLEINKEAVEMIKVGEYESTADKDFPFHKASKVVYPLLIQATIQLASRLITQIVRNERVVECVVLGADPDQQKAARAKRVSDFSNFECLVESDSWLSDQHKLCQMLAGWGTAFKDVFYDYVNKTVCSELVSPEDIVINTNISSLEKAPRITRRIYLTENQIIEQIRNDYFIDEDITKSGNQQPDNENQEHDSREKSPVYEFLRQTCRIDLDNDGYAEPYTVWVAHNEKILYGIYPAYELNDISIKENGKVKSIKCRNSVVDYHLIDDPEGKFYSLGLNHILVQLNRCLTSVLRQLLDAGTLANAAKVSGFVTRAFKTKERKLKIQLGQYTVVETAPGVKLEDQIMNLPFGEPSQVLLQLFEVLMQCAEKTGFITDILTGESEQQNVPATSALAALEQSTRAFKPVIQKLYVAEKKEFKLRYHLHSIHIDQPKYFKFQGQNGVVEKQDFDESNFDVAPVADPTMSSEAHKFARLQLLQQILNSPIAQAINVQEALTRIFTDLEFPNPQALVAQPKPPQASPPDPIEMAKLQHQQNQDQFKNQIATLKEQLAAAKLELEHRKTDIKETEVGIKAKESSVRNAKTLTDAHKDAMDVANSHRQTDIDLYNAETERERVRALENRPNDKKDT